MNKKITFGLLLCLFFIGHHLSAAPAVPVPVEITQPDGSRITVYLRGDEKVSWMESLDGFSLMYNDLKQVVYAELDADKNMVPSKTVFNRVSKAPDGVTKGIRYSSLQISTLKQIWDITEQAANSFKTQLRSATDETPYRVMCALVESNGKRLTQSSTEFENLMNQAGYSNSSGANGSVKDYYLENSYGKLKLEITVAGPYMLPKELSWYGENGTPGYSGDNSNRVNEMAQYAMEKAFEQHNINLYSNAGDGVVEAFHVIFAGYGEEAGGGADCIWSKAATAADKFYESGGISVKKFSCSPELKGNPSSNPYKVITTVGVICHELGHVFGSHDYYDYNYSFDGCGAWDLMASGSWNGDLGSCPAHFNMFQKMLFGWVSPVQLTSNQAISNMPASATKPVAYSIEVNTDNPARPELYVLENRQKTGFDAALPGHGLLIWHVHPDAWRDPRRPNDAHPQLVYPVSAASSDAMPSGYGTYGNINDGGTPFPGTAAKRAFTGNTTPAMFSWTGMQTVTKPVTEITERSTVNPGVNTVSFKFMDGPSDPVTNLQQTEAGGTVTLTWTAPNRPDVLGYRIYRNGLLQYTIHDKATTVYTQANVVNGGYIYSVSAFYANTESAPETKNVTVSGGSDTYRLPITNLQGVTTQNTATLSWTAPFNEGWKTIVPESPLFLSPSPYGTERIFLGALWGPDDWKGMDGYKITEIQFYMNVRENISYSGQIWEFSETEPQKVWDEAYGGLYNYAGTRSIVLSTPFEIDTSKKYLIGIEINTPNGSCITTDRRPTVEGRNWVVLPERNNALVAFEDLNNYNFYTSFKLLSGNPSLTPEYVIYKDGVRLGVTASTAYRFEDLTEETAYSYCVSALYPGDNESESVCISLTTQPPLNPYKSVDKLAATVEDNKVTLNWEAPFRGGAFSQCSMEIGGMSSSTGIIAARFTTDDLKKLLGAQLTAVQFANPSSVNIENTAYTLRIYAGNKDDEPERLIYSQEVLDFGTNIIDYYSINYVALATPITINVYEELWIGIEVEAKGTGFYYRTISDMGPLVQGKGDVYSYSPGHWGTSGWDRNWYIIGYAQYSGNLHAPPVFLSHDDASKSPEHPELSPPLPQVYATPTLYRISRDGVFIQEVESNVFTFEDYVSAPGEYSYCVTAIYSGGESDPACVDASYAFECTAKPENVTASLYGNFVNIYWDFTPVVVNEETIFSEDLCDGAPLWRGWFNINANDYMDQPWFQIWETGAFRWGCIASNSFDSQGEPLNPDNWLITEQIYVPQGGKLHYYVKSFNGIPGDHYGVFISTAYPFYGDISIFEPTPLFEETLFENCWEWQKRTIDLSAYAGRSVYIAFRHYESYYGMQMQLSTVSISQEVVPVFNVYKNGSLIADRIWDKYYSYQLSEKGVYNFCVSYAGSNCESEPVCVPSVRYNMPAEKIWNGANNNTWDNANNWLGGVPGAQDIVRISGNARNFPDLKDYQGTVTVAEIHFEPGSQLGYQSKLNGTVKAYIQYDLSKRERWNMLSVPLGQVYPGDFTFGGYPPTSVNKFTASGNGNKTQGVWENFKSSTRAFTPGDGLLLWLDPDGYAPKGLKLLDNSVRELPFFEHHDDSNLPETLTRYKAIHPYHDYNSSTQKSTFYNFMHQDPRNTPGQSYEVPRDGNAFKLAEKNFSKSCEIAGNFAFIGNPYMAAMNFDDFALLNVDSMRQTTYYVWSNTGGRYFVYNSLIEADLDEFIAPLQGFIVEIKNQVSDSIHLEFDESTTSVNRSAVLRSSGKKENTLNIVAGNPVAEVKAYIAKRDGGKDEYGELDSRKIFGEISNVPEIYTLKPYRDGSIAVAVNIVNNDNVLIPVGLSTAYTGDITLSLSGMDTYDADLSLIDAETKAEIPLTGASFDYLIDYTPKVINGKAAACEDRFFIRISKAVTGIEETIVEKVIVYESNGLIQIISSASNPVKDVMVYNLQGALVYKAASVNAISHTVNRNWPAGVYIVKVVSEKGIDNVKLVTSDR